jgi:hypothetical protein
VSLPLLIATTAIISGFFLTVVVMVVVMTCRKCRFSSYLLSHRLEKFVCHDGYYNETPYHDKKRIVLQEDLESSTIEKSLEKDVYTQNLNPGENLNIYVIQNPRILENVPNSKCTSTQSEFIYVNLKP